jgi:heme A synthase
MRIALNVVASLCLLIGCVWFLQGINVIPGSFMTGQRKWAIIGGLLVLAAIALFSFANRAAARTN